MLTPTLKDLKSTNLSTFLYEHFMVPQKMEKSTKKISKKNTMFKNVDKNFFESRRLTENSSMNKLLACDDIKGKLEIYH
jgi:hypothetical protein